MSAAERDHSLALPRRRFVQGVGAVGLAALVEGKITLVSAETSAHAPSVLTGNHFDLAIESHHVDFTGRRVKALKINGTLPGPTLAHKMGQVRVRLLVSFVEVI